MSADHTAESATPAVFVLDLNSNPHPKMRDSAITLRRAARRSGPDQDVWNGYLRCMADATGCDPAEIHRWLDRQEMIG